MNKSIIWVVIIAAAILQACGGGAASPSTVVTGDVAVPVINSISGNGSTDGVFANALVVTGENFSADMIVDLTPSSAFEVSMVKATDVNYSLTFVLDSENQITADLPPEIQPGDYKLTIAKASSSASSNITILQGEQGPQGVAGTAGLSIAHAYLCPDWSEDLDPSIDERKGFGTTVTEFTDGSWNITCQVYYFDNTLSYADSSSATLFFSSSSVADAIGVLACVPMYVTTFYSIEDNSVTYVNQADVASGETLECTKLY